MTHLLMVPPRWLALLVTVLLFAGCEPEDTQGGGPDLVVTDIRISPASGFIPLEGTVGLTIEALNAAGEVIDEPVDVRVASPEVLSYDQDSLKGVQNGSTQVEFQVGDVVRTHLYYVTRVPDGAVTVPQDAMLQEPESPEALLEPGDRYEVVLDLDAPPAEGVILLGEGDLELGGRVHAVEPEQGGYRVELELLTLDEMLPELVIDESLLLDLAQAQMTELTAAYYDQSIDDDGSVIYTLKDEPSEVPDKEPADTDDELRNLTVPLGTRTVDTFSCKGEVDPPFKFDALPLEIKLERDLDFDLDYDSDKGGLQRVYLGGQLVASYTMKPTMTAALSTKVTCKLVLGVYTLPIGGPVAMIFGAQVPLGLGFEVGGAIEVAKVGFELGVKVGAKMGAGLDCTSGTCEGITDFQNLSEGVYKTIGPEGGLDSQLLFKPKVGAFAFADLSLGPRWFRSLRYNLLTIKGGLTMSGDLFPVQPQLAIASQKSKYELLIEGSLGTAQDLTSFLRLVKLTGVKVELKVSEPISRSPLALTVTAEEDDSCHIELDPEDTDFLFYGYNVQDVAVVRYFEDAEGEQYHEIVAIEEASADQLVFDLEWSTEGQDGFTLGYSAFLSTQLLTVPDWNWIQLGDCTPPQEPEGEGKIYYLQQVGFDWIVHAYDLETGVSQLVPGFEGLTVNGTPKKMLNNDDIYITGQSSTISSPCTGSIDPNFGTDGLFRVGSTISLVSENAFEYSLSAATGKIGYWANDCKNKGDGYYLANLDGSNEELLFPIPEEKLFGDWRRLSPDGQWVAVVEAFGTTLSLMDLNTGAMTDTSYSFELPTDKPHWSWDSQQIAFFQYPENNANEEIVVFDVASDTITHTITPLTTLGAQFAEFHGELAWSPQGDKIAFAYDCDIYSVNLDGTELEMVVTHPTACLFNPFWAD